MFKLRKLIMLGKGSATSDASDDIDASDVADIPADLENYLRNTKGIDMELFLYNTKTYLSDTSIVKEQIDMLDKSMELYKLAEDSKDE